MIPVLFFCKTRRCRLILWEWNIVAPKEAKKINFLRWLCEIWSFDEGNTEKYKWKHNSQFYFQVKKARKLQKKQLFVPLWIRAGIRNYCMSRKCLQNAELHVTSMFLEGLFKRASLFRKWSSEKKSPIQNTWSIWEKSNIIVDLLQDKQEGITVRTLEGVFYGKKFSQITQKSGRATCMIPIIFLF